MTSGDYVERDLESYRRRAGSAVLALTEQIAKCTEAEQAIAAVTSVLVELNGDRQAHKIVGSLKPGEQQYFIAGCFLLGPRGDHHLLVAENGFPAEQHRLKIPVDLGHPGRVYRERKPLLLANTDEHGDFKQILKTSRMGSAIYAPMIWQGRFVGQMINAAQARNTMSEADLQTLVALTHLATLAFVALGGELHE